MYIWVLRFHCSWVYIFIGGKRFVNICDIQIVLDYEMKLKIYYISISCIFLYIEGYVYIAYL